MFNLQICDMIKFLIFGKWPWVITHCYLPNIRNYILYINTWYFVENGSQNELLLIFQKTTQLLKNWVTRTKFVWPFQTLISVPLHVSPAVVSWGQYSCAVWPISGPRYPSPQHAPRLHWAHRHTHCGGGGDISYHSNTSYIVTNNMKGLNLLSNREATSI